MVSQPGACAVCEPCAARHPVSHHASSTMEFMLLHASSAFGAFGSGSGATWAFSFTAAFGLLAAFGCEPGLATFGFELGLATFGFELGLAAFGFGFGFGSSSPDTFRAWQKSQLPQSGFSHNLACASSLAIFLTEFARSSLPCSPLPHHDLHVARARDSLLTTPTGSEGRAFA
eukprot:scaffold90816_cov63-Phaeocystis_antarctica.AAC.2